MWLALEMNTSVNGQRTIVCLKFVDYGQDPRTVFYAIYDGVCVIHVIYVEIS